MNDKAEEEIKRWADEWNAWYKIGPRLDEYRKFAWAKIEEHDPEEVEQARSMLIHCDFVQYQVNKDNAESAALEMMMLCNAAARLEFIPSVIELRKFRGPKNDRADKLRELMIEETRNFFHSEGDFPSAQELWDTIKAGHARGVYDFIQEMTDTIIYWKTGKTGKKNQEETTDFHAFESRLSRIKKKYF